MTAEEIRALRHARRVKRRLARRERNKRRLLVTISILPSMFTLSNGLLGFAAVYLATRTAIDGEPALLGVAAWLLFAAMVCDMIDGRLARFARKTSDFGAQLDSMCDVISFGIAPPILMIRTVMGAVHGQISKIPLLWRLSDVGVERVLWIIGAVYVAGAAMRLARFNVENEPDESAHMSFRGLPSPGAAAAVATLVLLFDHLMHPSGGIWTGPWPALIGPETARWFAAIISLALPLMTLAAGLLMVSTFRYPHLINQYIRGRKPFAYLVKLVLLLAAGLVEPFITMAAAATTYTLWAPITAILRRTRLSGSTTSAPPSGSTTSAPPSGSTTSAPPSGSTTNSPPSGSTARPESAAAGLGANSPPSGREPQPHGTEKADDPGKMP
jgi:CDP-diacylglycerol--serine O-phosphatidyltransferase